MFAGTPWHPLRLWYAAETGHQAPEGSSSCWLCACPSPPSTDTPTAVAGSIYADLARLAKGVFSGNFMDYDKGRGGTDIVCPACAAYFTYTATAPDSAGKGGASGKLFTWHLKVFRSGWERWDRESMADDLIRWVREGLPDDGAFGVTYSHKKHTLPWARVNTAGSRNISMRLDGAEVRFTSDALPVLAAVADLMCRGYAWRKPKHKCTTGAPQSDCGRCQLIAGRLHARALSHSDNPAADLATVALIAPHAGSPLPELCAYILTKDNHARHARKLKTFLRCPRPLPAEGGAPVGDSQRGSKSGVQKPLPAQVVDNCRRKISAGGDDKRQSGGMEQQSLF